MKYRVALVSRREAVQVLSELIECGLECRGALVGNPDPEMLEAHDQMLRQARRFRNTIRKSKRMR